MDTERPQSEQSAVPASAAAGESAGASAFGAPRFFFVAASVAMTIGVLHVGQPLLMPVALAALLAFVLDPLVTRLRRIGVPKVLAVTLVIAMALGVFASLAVLAVQQITTLSRELPTYQITIQKKLRTLRPAPGGNSLVRGASRLVAVVEGEVNAARAAIAPAGAGAGTAPAPAPARVVVEQAPPSPLRVVRQMVGPLLVPLASAGLAIVLLAYTLAQRREISDRLMRLAGGDLHRMAEALNEAARRVSRYLAAQLLVSIGFGVCLALGLSLIGVPGAMLWGALAALLRFVPYLGPLLAAVLPLLLAFAVDPGWSMLLWAAALIVGLELVCNNVVEPLAYGGSTGVSPVAVLVSAGFWVLVWGPGGLVVATPLTVCLVVLGRHLGALHFLDVLLGTDPAFDRPTQLYRSLISGDSPEAVAQAGEEAEQAGVRGFYSDTGVPMLALASAWSAGRASATQRHRALSGAAQIVEELRADHGGAESAAPRVLCVGARSEFDTLSAEMLAHALAHEGVPARSLPTLAVSAGSVDAWPLEGVSTLVLCTFHPRALAPARLVCKRVRRRAPALRIVLAAWTMAVESKDAAALESIGVDARATTLAQAVSYAAAAGEAATADSRGSPPGAPPGAPPEVSPEASPEASSEASTEASPGAPFAPAQERLARAVQRAAEVFDVPLAGVLWRHPDGTWLRASAGRARSTHEAMSLPALLGDGTPWAAVLTRASSLAVPDTTRSPEWPALSGAGLAAFAGVPMIDGARGVAGVFALHDSTARDFSDEDMALLGRVAQELCDELAETPRSAATSASAHEPEPEPERTRGSSPVPLDAD